MASRQLRIAAGDVTATATLNDTGMADLIWEACPMQSIARTWGDEIYFEIPVDTPGEDLQPTVGMGDLAYWPPGPAFCIFFGPTPMSSGDEIRPASPVSVFGRVDDDATIFKQVRGGSAITVEQVT
jgi:uncharacterized protein